MHSTLPMILPTTANDSEPQKSSISISANEVSKNTSYEKDSQKTMKNESQPTIITVGEENQIKEEEEKRDLLDRLHAFVDAQVSLHYE